MLLNTICFCLHDGKRSSVLESDVVVIRPSSIRTVTWNPVHRGCTNTTSTSVLCSCNLTQLHNAPICLDLWSFAYWRKHAGQAETVGLVDDWRRRPRSIRGHMYTAEQLSMCVHHSWLSSRIYCFSRVIDDTCNTSAADINVLKTVIYSLKLSQIERISCALGWSIWCLCIV